MVASGITSFGGPMILRKVTQGVYDNATREQPPPVTTDYPVLARDEDQEVADEPGREVQLERKVIKLLAQSLPPGIVPEKTDFMVSDKQYTILKVGKNTGAGNNPFAYILEVQA